MAEYSVYNRPGARPEDAVFLREGFSGRAFLFTVLWALWHRLWLVAAILLSVMVLASAGATYLGLNEMFATLLGLAVNLIFGLIAKDLEARSLLASGYQETGFSVGRTIEEAEIRYFHELNEPPAASPGQLRPVPPLRAPDTLGIFSNV